MFICSWASSCKQPLRHRSLFIAWGGGHLISRRTKGVISHKKTQKGVITEDFGMIQRGDHMNLLGKRRHGGEGGIVKVINCY